MTITKFDTYRSRRLRKKLHVGEFKEMGFEFAVDFKVPLTPETEECLLDCFLSELIEPRSLALGGWITEGFICHYGRGSTSDEDQKAVKNWLDARPEIAAIRIGPLMDAWYL